MRPLRIKPGCDFTGIHPDVVFWVGVVAGHHLELTGRPLWVTSARRQYRSGVISRHSPPLCAVHGVLCAERPDLGSTECRLNLVTAWDFRRWYLDEKADRAERFCKMLQEKYGTYLGIVLEPEWLSAAEVARRGGIKKVSPHVHCQTKRELLGSAASIRGMRNNR